MSWTLLTLIPIGLFAGLVNTLAGGGSFLTLSAMIWLGFPPQVANATNRVGVIFQSGAATASFHRSRVSGGPGLGLELLAVCGGAAVGAWVSTAMDAQAFKTVLGLAMVAMVTLTLFKPRRWAEPGPPSAWRWPALVGAGFYGGLLQAGVGILLLPALALLGGRDAVAANARKVALVAALTLPALVIYQWEGLVDWAAGLFLAVGSSAGGWLGSKLTVRGGHKLVLGAMVAVVVVTAGRLLLW